MSLQNIFTMIKADRYTEDGCGELNKARKEIEDARRTYKPGEISEKTGLQKQSNGKWAPPKKGGSSAGAKKDESGPAKSAGGKSGVDKTKTLTEWEESAKTDARLSKENMVIMQHPDGRTTAVSEGSPDVEKAETKGFKKMSLVRPDGSVKRHSENSSATESRVDLWLKEDPSKLSDEELMRKNETLHDLSKSANGEDFKKIMNAGIAIEEELTKRKLPTNPGGIGYADSKKSALSKPEMKLLGPNSGDIKIINRAAKKEWEKRNPELKQQETIEEKKKMDALAQKKLKEHKEKEREKKERPSKKALGAFQNIAHRPNSREYIKSKSVDEIVSEMQKQGRITTPEEISEAKRITGIFKELVESTSDSAPRVLTGDCRIRIRK